MIYLVWFSVKSLQFLESQLWQTADLWHNGSKAVPERLNLCKKKNKKKEKEKREKMLSNVLAAMQCWQSNAKSARLSLAVLYHVQGWTVPYLQSLHRHKTNRQTDNTSPLNWDDRENLAKVENIYPVQSADRTDHRPEFRHALKSAVDLEWLQVVVFSAFVPLGGGRRAPLESWQKVSPGTLVTSIAIIRN